MKKIFGKKQNILNKVAIKMAAVFLCFFAQLFLFANNVFAGTLTDIRTNTVWDTNSGNIEKFYVKTYELIMAATGEFAWNANYMISNYTDTLLGIGFAIWIAGFIGINVFASVTNASITKIIPAVLIRGFIVMAVATILDYNGNSSNMPLFKEFLRPFVIATYSLGADYMASETYTYGSGSFTFAACKSGIESSYSDASPVLPSSVSAERAVYLNNMKPTSANMFTADMVLYGGCLLSQVAYSVDSIGSLGTAMIIDSLDYTHLIFMHVLEFIAGVCICICSFWLLLMVPICLLDSVWKLVIFAACFPILFVLWAFPITRKYFNRGFFLFVHSCLHVIFMCVILGFCISAMGVFAQKVGIFSAVNSGISMSTVKNEYSNFTNAGFTALLIMPWITVIMVEKAEIFADFFANIRVGGLDSSVDAFRSARSEVSGKVTRFAPKVVAMGTKGR